MRVLQLIDSLEAGGAERVAVNIANALSSEIEASFLCATRKEGLLKPALNNDVGYLFLKKKSVLDIKALWQLNRFVRQQNIKLIHAHSTSFFLATFIKIVNPKIKIVWHDHYGNSEHLDIRKHSVLRFCSRYFVHVLSVNTVLQTWAKQSLKTKDISYLPNFAVNKASKSLTHLYGETGKRLLHLANLRVQKDHQTLLKAFSKISESYPDWTLHCVGKDFNDGYSETIKRMIKDLGLSDQVFLYGSCSDISNIIDQSDIGVLSSKSEGLPIALLEYGLAGLPAIVTDVGDCSQVVENGKNGQLIQPENSNELMNAMHTYISNAKKRKTDGQYLKQTVETHFSEKAAIDKIVNIYKRHQL